MYKFTDKQIGEKYNISRQALWKMKKNLKEKNEEMSDIEMVSLLIRHLEARNLTRDLRGGGEEQGVKREEYYCDFTLKEPPNQEKSNS